MTTEEVYTDAIDNTYLEWTGVGNTPYLQNTDSDLINKNIAGKKEGCWTFPNSVGSGTINSVKLRFEGRVSIVDANGWRVYVWDGSSWINAGAFYPPSTSYAWYEKDVSTILNTWTKINGCKVYIVSIRASGIIYVRRLTRKVDYSVPVAVKRVVGDGLTFVIA